MISKKYKKIYMAIILVFVLLLTDIISTQANSSELHIHIYWKNPAWIDNFISTASNKDEVTIFPIIHVMVAGNTNYDVSLYKTFLPLVEKDYINPIRPKIIIITYNPWLSSVGKSLFEYESNNDPSITSAQLCQDFFEASNGFVDIQIVGRIDRNEFPIEEDGLRMSEAEYLQLRSQGLSYWHVHGVRTDIRRLIEDNGLNLMVKNHQIDEVWVFESWTFSFFESYMGGPGAFWVNGPTFDTDSGRAFVVMGFENAVGIPNSLHSIGHRVESTLDQAYGYSTNYQITPWARYRKHANMPDDWLPGVPYGVGDIENPPNSSHNYDYINQNYVYSTAEDWLNFPNLTGEAQLINAEAWNSYDYGYYKWWYSHLPKAEGVSARSDSSPGELRQNNWWKYIFDFNNYPELVDIQNNVIDN